MASSGTTQMSAPAASAAASAASTRSTLPDRSPTTVLSCAAARRRCGIDPDYRWPPAASSVPARVGSTEGGGPGMRSLCGAEPAGLRAPDRGGAGHPLRPAVVHRRAGDPEGVQHHLGRAGERARRGHDLRRLGHRRIQPGPGGRRPGPPRPQDLPAAALAPRRRGGGPGLLRHRQPRRHPVRGRPPPRPAADARAGPRRRLHLLRLARGRVLLLRRRRPRAAARSPSTRAPTSTCRWPT